MDANLKKLALIGRLKTIRQERSKIKTKHENEAVKFYHSNSLETAAKADELKAQMNALDAEIEKLEQETKTRSSRSRGKKAAKSTVAPSPPVPELTVAPALTVAPTLTVAPMLTVAPAPTSTLTAAPSPEHAPSPTPVKEELSLRSVESLLTIDETVSPPGRNNKPLKLTYLSLSKDERDVYDAKVDAQLERYCADKSMIPYDSRKTIRQVRHIGPQAAQISYDLALVVHENHWDNKQCRFHERTKNFGDVDGKLDPKNSTVVYGVAHKSTIGAKKGTSTPPEEGFMHCGCQINEVLLDFYFWKTWTAKSYNEAYSSIAEALGSDYFNPRIRTFVVQAFLRESFLTLNDLYAPDFATENFQLRLRSIQAERIVARLNSMWKGALGVRYILTGPTIALPENNQPMEE
ncbi:hypothetical protein BDN70DRAFT_938572 [Pholiota conissans]|uniref:Uncharacterized protein n=1 Tax=Pholiota conissans TaxID=109636 RepID=A0A9P5YN04_9AGAR|nr:hypothetical protein BDN70DRAFT_938572 [Pholiota conissans]